MPAYQDVPEALAIRHIFIRESIRQSQSAAESEREVGAALCQLQSIELLLQRCHSRVRQFVSLPSNFTKGVT
jgi:hypothetical protein